MKKVSKYVTDYHDTTTQLLAKYGMATNNRAALRINGIIYAKNTTEATVDNNRVQ